MKTGHVVKHTWTAWTLNVEAARPASKGYWKHRCMSCKRQETGSNHLSLHHEENAAVTVDQPCERSPLRSAKSCKFSPVRSGWSHTRRPYQGLTKALRWNARPTHPAGSGVPFSLGTAKDHCLNRSVENYILDGHLKHCWGVVCLNEKRHACKTTRGPESSLPSPQLAVPALG